MTLPVYSYRHDHSVPEFRDDKPIIVFDGHCVLCSAFANFVIKHDTQRKLRLLAAQTELGEALYRHYGLKPDDYSTNLLIENGVARVKSDGTMAMFAYLGWPWKIITIGRVLPLFLRDRIYSFIARNRFNWFGRNDVCYMAPPDARERFL